MVSVEKALEIISAVCGELPAKKLALTNAFDHVLAKDVLSPVDMPPFCQSAMDGYAIHYDPGIHQYQVVGEIQAGSDLKPQLKKGEAVRIFTGAAVPDSATLVIQQELIKRENNSITLEGEIKPGMNMRPQGEQIKKNKLALSKKSILNPAAIGYLASIGVPEVMVIPKPKIAILTTGNELIEPGSELNYGQVYESNSLMLSSALQQFHFEKPSLIKVKDEQQATQDELEKLISAYDVVLISGGISVGDYDFVKSALENLGVKEQFYKISQKPGKPLYFGVSGKKLIFALPGNPASALTCFYIYVLPALNKISGKEFSGLRKITALLNGSYKKKRGMAHFLKSRVDEAGLTILDAQSSAMLNTFAVANGLVYVPAESEELVNGLPVTVYLLDR
jgi:molybdopterin molybdotransferase